MNPISVYAANLKRRPDRKASIEAQFAGRPEFHLTVVEAIEHTKGFQGLWQTFYQIVQQEATKGSDYFIFCEDDHVFTENYSTDFLLERIQEADNLKAELLSGGFSWWEVSLQVSDHLFWVEKFNGMQFTVIYRRFYKKILATKTIEGFVLDLHLSMIAKNKFTIFPYISTQQEFGYSDATVTNNKDGQVDDLFEISRNAFQQLAKVRNSYKKIPENLVDVIRGTDVSKIFIPTYVINLPERTERRERIEKEFNGRTEFDLHIVEACKHEIGAVGLWNSLRSIVKKAKENEEDAILICEDDHFFTPHYDRERFLRQVMLAGAMGTQLLSGGVGGFGHYVPVPGEMFWTDWFWCTQFIVLYKNAFQPILEAPFAENDTADGKLSEILSNKLVTAPFISEQKDYGYSDVTKANNEAGKIEEYFNVSRYRLSLFEFARERFLSGKEIPDNEEDEFQCYLREYPVRRLHIGCGKNILKGWFNTDLQPELGAFSLSACSIYPYPDGCFDYIFSEHLFEHLSYKDGKRMLQQCYRVLKPGGILRITLPTQEFLLRLYSEAKEKKTKEYALWYLKRNLPDIYEDFVNADGLIPLSLVINDFMRRWGHQCLYDIPTLKKMIEHAGFQDLQTRPIGESPYPDLNGIERHGTIIPDWANKMESITLEARKPLQQNQ